MDDEGIILSIIDQLVYQVSKSLSRDVRLCQNVISKESSCQTEEIYNLHEFNDLYPHYSLKPVNQSIIDLASKMEILSKNIDLSAENKSEMLNKLFQNSEKLVKHSENVMRRLDDIEKVFMPIQQNILIPKNITMPIQTERSNKVEKNAIENIKIEIRSEISNVKLDDLDEENEIVLKRPKLRIGLSKRRSMRESEQWNLKLDTN